MGSRKRSYCAWFCSFGTWYHQFYVANGTWYSGILSLIAILGTWYSTRYSTRYQGSGSDANSFFFMVWYLVPSTTYNLYSDCIIPVLIPLEISIHLCI